MELYEGEIRRPPQTPGRRVEASRQAEKTANLLAAYTNCPRDALIYADEGLPRSTAAARRPCGPCHRYRGSVASPASRASSPGFGPPGLAAAAQGWLASPRPRLANPRPKSAGSASGTSSGKLWMVVTATHEYAAVACCRFGTPFPLQMFCVVPGVWILTFIGMLIQIPQARRDGTSPEQTHPPCG